MSGMNVDWAIRQLDRIVNLTDQVEYADPDIIGTHTRGSELEIASQSQVVEQILSRVLPNWRRAIPRNDYFPFEQVREAATRAKSQLQRAGELRANLGDDAPEISAAKLHPWVWNGASSLWQSGHYRQAVEDALKKVNAETQNKLGRRDVSETDLFTEAFSDNTAAPNKPRLRRMTPDGTDTYKSMQRGARSLAEGIYAGIRNPFGHGDPSKMDIDEEVGLEYLAAISVLARWVDDATVEAAP